MGSQCSFSRRGVEWWWQGTKRKVLNFLERMDDRIKCTHEETFAVVKPWEDIGSNKSLGCVFSEKPADWTNAFKLEISSLADFYDVLLHGQNDSKVPGRIREGDVVRAKSNRIREGNGRMFQGRRKGKEKSFCFVVVQFELILSSMFFGEVSHFTERNGFLDLCVICEKLMVYSVVSYDIGERHSVQDEENGPKYWALRHTVHSCDGDEDELLTEVDLYLSERYDWNHWSAVDWMPKTEFRRERRIWWSIVSKAAERSNKRRTEMLSLSWAERILFT